MTKTHIECVALLKEVSSGGDVEIIVKGTISVNAEDRVRALKMVTHAMCQSIGLGPDDGVRTLLRAAVEIAEEHHDAGINMVAAMVERLMQALFPPSKSDMG